VNPENAGGFTNRIDDNIFRDVWLTPDVNRLLPPDADSPLYEPGDALLSRKDLIAVAREVSKKWGRPGSLRAGLRLPMGLTVTRVRPESFSVSGVEVQNQREYIPFEMRIQANGAAKFFFNPDDYSSLADPAMILMPWPADGTPFSVSTQQVIDTLMTTSAFPAGFGRMRLQYCRLKTHPAEKDSAAMTAMEAAGPQQSEPVCPAGYELAEAEFADGGLFDNLPIGLARLLSESSKRHKKNPLPVNYIYLDPNRQRYENLVPEVKRACEGENPPEACREMTFDFASELTVLGGAIGTARKYELFRELTGDNWRLNLSQLSREMAGNIDANKKNVKCDSALPYFDRQLGCSDRLRYASGLLELTKSYRLTPIQAPLSVQALKKARITTTCQPPSTKTRQDIVSECVVDAPRLRKQLATALTNLSKEIFPDQENLQIDIRQSALSINSDRSVHVTNRGGPITGQLLGAFGAFIDYKFREFDYYVGIYDAIVNFSNVQCARTLPLQDQQTDLLTCRDQLSEQLFQLLEVTKNPKGRYVFARMAMQEFGKAGGLRYAYDPMPLEDRDMRIIYEGLHQLFITDRKSSGVPVEELSTEHGFFEYLKTEGFKPTPPPEGGKSLLGLIMDDPDYWSHELVNRATERLVYLEKQAEAIYQAREPDPENQDTAHTALMGAGALVLRTAAYQYPKFTFSPSTAPEAWIWRNIIPYEAAFDLAEGDILAFWQPTWNTKYTNVGIRFGVGFTGGLFSSNADESRKNYGMIGIDLTRMTSSALFSGWGITPAVYHYWKEPSVGDQTSMGLDVHANLLKNRLRISLGARDISNRAGDTLFLTLGVTDLPGLVYWLGQ